MSHGAVGPALASYRATSRSVTATRGPAAGRGALLAGPLLAAAACTSIPEGRDAVDAIDFEGVETLREQDIRERLATGETPKFLGLMRGVVFDYEVFDQFVLQRDIQRIERLYRSRGFYQTRARAARVFRVRDRHVRVHVVIEEGPRTYVRAVTIRGLEGVPHDIAEDTRLAATGVLAVGDALDEDAFAAAEDALARSLADVGYAYVRVQRDAAVDLPGSHADVTYTVRPGPRARFGRVTIQGLGGIPEAPVRRALDISPGEPYSVTALEDARQALLDLGVFRSVVLEPDLPDPPPPRPEVPLTVKVEPAALRSLRLGGGVQLDVIRTDVHLLIGWEHRNFLGGLRRFSVEFRPGLVFYPTRLPTLQAPTHFLPEEQFRMEIEQPGFLEARTGGFLRGEFNIFPLLLTPQVDEEAPVLGYRELRAGAGVRRRFRRFFTEPSQNLQTNVPFAYAGTLDPDLDGVIISFTNLVTSLDLRDDPVQPRRGIYLENELQVAGLGGDARDVRVRPDVRGYVPIARPVTLALRASVGFLFPFNYGDTLEENALTNGAPPGTERAAWVRDTQLVFFRAFFSGGPNSNRGYPFRGVGPHGVAPFFVPGLTPEQIALECAGENRNEARCAVPLGGLTLWEASAEMRYDLADPLSAATFCDASDVSAGRMDLRLNHPHLSCGFGLRYGTPVGPIRFDLGYRIPGLQVLVDDVPRSSGAPGSILGLPIAINVGVGEAF
jgi:outer membrane protein assembly factor BamA